MRQLTHSDDRRKLSWVSTSCASVKHVWAAVDVVVKHSLQAVDRQQIWQWQLCDLTRRPDDFTFTSRVGLLSTWPATINTVVTVWMPPRLLYIQFGLQMHNTFSSHNELFRCTSAVRCVLFHSPASEPFPHYAVVFWLYCYAVMTERCYLFTMFQGSHWHGKSGIGRVGKNSREISLEVWENVGHWNADIKSRDIILLLQWYFHSWFWL